MDRILLGLGAAGAALLIIAIAVAWWEHRRHAVELRRQLAWSENTRDLLQAHAKDVETRLSALTATVQAHQQSHQGSGTAREPNSTAPDSPPHFASPSVLAAAATAAAAGAQMQHWKDTEPMVLAGPVLDFDPTLPATVAEH
jgi:hypothetical protein